MTADFYIEKLNLVTHPEGGYFSEIYRSEEIIKKDALSNHSGDRSLATSIYFLLKEDQKSFLHKLKSDEVWHFYEGSSIKFYTINKQGILSEFLIGRNIERGEVLQFVIKKEQWFCAEITDKKSFSLIGCSVSPGFDFSDFQLGKRKILIELFPQHKEIITAFTSK